MTKATHNGTCQACGRVQAVKANGRLAKHGYTVDFGYFSGTCRGSDRAPLEIDRSHCDQTIVDLREYAGVQASKTPADIEAVTVKAVGYANARRGRGQTLTVRSDEELAELVAERKVPNYSPRRSFADLQQAACREAHRAAEQALVAADALVTLADERHGQDLLPREATDEAEKDRFFVNGSYRDVAAKVAELEATGRYSKVTSRRQGFGGFNITATRR